MDTVSLELSPSRLSCWISPALEIPLFAYNDARGQYDSKAILTHLLQNPYETTKVLGVTHVDLYVPILKYVFGLAQIEGPCALISLHRLAPQFYDKPSDWELFMSRIEKTALHELGHSFGLTHCKDRRCIMYSATRIEDTDHKKAKFCPNCFELLKWYISKYAESEPMNA